MIDTVLVALTKKALTDLQALKADGRPSEKRLVREKFAVDFLAALEHALDFTPEQKIKIFDQMAESHVQDLKDEVESWLSTGEQPDNEDTADYVWEHIRITILGPKAFDATNALQDIFLSR